MGSHYYDLNGNLQLDANLRDARKYNLFPSCTTVLQILAKPGLEIWKMEQIMLSALTSVKYDMETETEYIQRIINDSKKESEDAKDFGIIIHNLIERFLLNGFKHEQIDSSYEKNVILAYNSVTEYIMDNFNIDISNSEKTLVSKKYGYAGTIDWHGCLKDNRYAVVDWKTQNVKYKGYKRQKNELFEKEKDGMFYRPSPTTYDEYIFQLASYMNLVQENYSITPDVCIAVTISSNPECAGYYHIKEIDSDSIEWGLNSFLAILNLWRLIKKFEYKK